MNDGTPATKAQLDALEERLLEKTETQLDGLEERLLARLEKAETHLLTEFRLWARRSDTRQKATSILVNSFDERLGDLEDQVSDLRDRIK